MRWNAARISQLLFLLLFLLLFITTEYRGHDQINAAVNAFFRADPLVLVSYLLAAKSWSWLLLPGLLLVLATLLLGRFFCGWVCPLGTLLDWLTPRTRRTTPIPWLAGNRKYWLLLPLLFASLFNLNLAGLFDPLALLVRGLTFFFYPLVGLAARSGWVELYRLIGEQRDSLASAYGLIRDYLLPFRETIYPLAAFSALLLIGIVLLERLETRAWCRHLCPLGTLLGWLGRFLPFQRVPAGLCSDCGQCRELCPTTFDQGLLQREECILCLDCQAGCPHGRIRFQPLWQLKLQGPLLPQRRVLLGSLAGGLLLAVPARFRLTEQGSGPLRPPGVRDEEAFLKQCVRCGECMKVCLKNALYPATWQAGLPGFYTPVLIPRLGYCEYQCTLCGQVCPTGAIPRLAPPAKKREVIGKAVFDKNHCLPFARKIDCIVCEEHCPIPEKAIRSREVTVVGLDGTSRVIKEPYIVEELCNGCGICEHVCPVETRVGVRIHGVKNRRPLAEGGAVSDQLGY